MPGQFFSPNTALVLVLGRSEFPFSPKLTSSEIFSRTAAAVVRYLTDQHAFGLPNDEFHFLNLFNYDASPLDVNRRISKWLAEAQEHAATTGNPTRDLIVYYIGHGGFTPGGEQAYFLALRSTEANNEGISSLRMTDFARTITREAKTLRRYLILNCCFAESAHSIFQSEGGDPANAAHMKALFDFPERGTALLCSSSARDVSIAPKGQQFTMFSGALLDVLATGDDGVAAPLSLVDLGKRVERLIIARYADSAVKA